MINLIRNFSLVAQSDSLSDAARRLGVSPATVSRHIQSIEDEFKTQLFFRSTRSLSLTESGKVFLERAQRILEEIEQARIDINELEAEPRGRLHIHSRGLVGRYLVIPVLAKMRTAYPNVDLILTLTDAPLDLAERNIDVSIRGAKDEGMDLLVRKLASYRRVLCASPDFIATHGSPMSPVDLEQFNCVTFQFNLGQQHWHFRKCGRTTSVTPKAVAQANDGEALRLLALQGLGIAMMPEWSVQNDFRKKRLVKLLPDYEFAPGDASFEYPVYALYQRSHYRSQRLKAFLSILVDSMKEQAKSGWLRPNVISD